MSFPLRYQLALALVGLNIIGTAAVAGFAYRASRDTLENQATRAVGVVAQEREHALLQLLQRRQERMDAFLESTESLCGERGPKGKLGWESECVAGGPERISDRRAGGRGRVAVRRAPVGGWWLVAAFACLYAANQLVTIARGEGHSDYTMQAVRGLLALRVRLPLDDIDALFQDRSGLEANGEVFLTDSEGRLLTPARYPSSRISACSMDRCNPVFREPSATRSRRTITARM